MTATSKHNRYLVTAGGRYVASRTLPGVILLGGVIGGPIVGTIGAIVGDAIDSPVIVAVALLVGFLAFVGATVAAWVFLLGGSKDLTLAAQFWLSGHTASAIPLCHRPLARVFRGDLRMRAFYTLGLCAEANGDFAEAEDLFRRSYEAIPAMAAPKLKRRGQCMMLAHRAVALVALRRLDEADIQVRQASLLFPPVPTNGIVDALTDDTGFGAAGISTALRDIEPGRDPRALLSLASVVVLAARGMGREALELANREHACLNAGLMPREKALLGHVEARGHGMLPGGGPMRAPGLAGGPGDPWAERILPLRA